LSARATAVQPVVKDARGKLIKSLAIAAAGSGAYSVYANDLAGSTQAQVAGAESSSSETARAGSACCLASDSSPPFPLPSRIGDTGLLPVRGCALPLDVPSSAAAPRSGSQEPRTARSMA